jgi:hypothetical protein
VYLTTRRSRAYLDNIVSLVEDIVLWQDEAGRDMGRVVAGSHAFTEGAKKFSEMEFPAAGEATVKDAACCWAALRVISAAALQSR